MLFLFLLDCEKGMTNALSMTEDVRIAPSVKDWTELPSVMLVRSQAYLMFGDQGDR